MKRLTLLAVLVCAELLAASLYLDGASLAQATGIPGWIGAWGAWILRGAIGFAVSFIAFAWLSSGPALRDLVHQPDRTPIRWPWLSAHVPLAVTFAFLSRTLYAGAGASNLLGAAWLLSGAAALYSLSAGLLGPRFGLDLLRATGPTWIYAASVSILAVGAVQLSRSLWQTTAELTFRIVQILLRPIFPDLLVQPEILRVRAPNFGVIIDQACSGLEGAGLMIVFAAVWLIVCRRDYRFPRSLLLIPIGVVILYLLNAVRIAALVVIGNAGFRQIAIGGFHSQAGWIAFNGVAFGMTLVAPRFTWFRLHPNRPQPIAQESADNPTAAYLMPFLAILAAGMLARAASADFEWLYPLRFLAAAVTLWLYRHQFTEAIWTWTWRGIAAGAAVFALWIALDAWNQTPTAPIPAPLQAVNPWLRISWISIRAAAAILTVPLAEELGFRGFLLRRFQNPDFQSVSYRSTSWLAILGSSLAFGFLHGDRWLAGVLAGLVFAWLPRRSNALGEAVAAHATANALLAYLAVVHGQWQYW